MWVVFELGLRVIETVQRRGGIARERGTRVVIALALGGAVGLSFEQPVISTGPYAYVRHPSYTGLLLIVAGAGLAVGNWLGLALCVLLPLPALVVRIRVEEAELVRVLGEPYRRYAARTKRLVPGVW